MEMILDIHLTYSYMYIHNVIINIITYMTECWRYKHLGNFEQDESLNFNQIWNILKFLFMYRAEVKR